MPLSKCKRMPRSVTTYHGGARLAAPTIRAAHNMSDNVKHYNEMDQTSTWHNIIPRHMGRYPQIRLTSENPIEAIITRLQQFTSIHLAGKLVLRRAAAEQCLNPSSETNGSKARGVAYTLRSALDYIQAPSGDKLIRRVLNLYYGVMALAQAEMLASPRGPINLDKVEDTTKYGHGLYTWAPQNGGFADLQVGVLKTGFLAHWMKFLGYDISNFPTKRPRTQGQVDKIPSEMICTLENLFASMPEIHDLFADVFLGPPRWFSVVHDTKANYESGGMAGTTFGLFIDRSSKIPASSLASAPWPLADIQLVDYVEGPGNAFRARVNHEGHGLWWDVLPTHSSPFREGKALLLPNVAGLREYRVIAAVTLYALSIMARYMPSAWQRIEGEGEDLYYALVKESLAVWERVLPQQFLESITGETVSVSQPGTLL